MEGTKVAPEALTSRNAPVGTKAPAIMGGHWYKTDRGWKWNGPNGSGGTFPNPGGDWNGELIPPGSDKSAQSMTNCQEASPTFRFRIFGYGVLVRKASGLPFRDSYRAVRIGGWVIKLLRPSRLDEWSLGKMKNNRKAEGPEGGIWK